MTIARLADRQRRLAGWAGVVRVTLRVAAVVALPVSASAQLVPGPVATPVSRQIVTSPFNGRGGQSGLQLNSSLFESYDVNNNTPVDPSGNPPGTATAQQAPVYWQSGLRTGGTVGLDGGYTKQWTRASFGASGRTSASAFSRSDRVLWVGSGTLTQSLPLGQKTSITSSQTLLFRPYYAFGLFPGVNDPSAAGLLSTTDSTIDTAVFPNQSYEYGVSAAVSHQLSRRSSLQFDYTQRYTDFRDGRKDFDDRQVGGRFSHQLGRSLGAHVGYRYGRANYATVNGLLPVRHDLDIGLDYGFGKSFSLGRRTSFQFNSGSSILSESTANGFRFTRNSFKLTGGATLRHDMGRTWVSRISYRRGWDVVQGFATPFFTDTFSAGIGGLLGRRGSLGAVASYLNAGSLHSSQQGQQTSVQMSAQVRRTLSNWSSIYAQYNFYRYDFSNGFQLPIGFPGNLARQNVRAGFSIGVPLLQ